MQATLPSIRPVQRIAFLVLRFADLVCQQVCITNQGTCACATKKQGVESGEVAPDALLAQEDLTIAFAAAALEQAGRKVEVIDQALTRSDDLTMAALALRGEPDVLVLSSNFFHESVDHVDRLRALAQVVREQRPETVVLLHSFAASLAAGQLLMETPAIDAVIIGEVEPTILDVADRLERKISLDETPGLARRRSRTPPRHKLVDLSRLPTPKRYLLDAEGLRERADSIAVIQGSRGCTFSCAFCDVPAHERMNVGAPWRPRTAAAIVAEMAALHIRYGIDRFVFNDNLWTGPANGGTRRRIIEFAELLKNRRLPIQFQIAARVDSFDPRTDRDLLETLVSAGLTSMFIGVDSGDVETLKMFSKGIYDSQRAAEALSFVRDCGVLTKIGFINFHPFATVESLHRNADYLCDLSHGHDVRLFCSRLAVRTHHRLYDVVQKAGLLLGDKPWNVQRYRFQHRAIETIYQRVRLLGGRFTPLDTYVAYLERRLWTNGRRQDAVSLVREISALYRPLYHRVIDHAIATEAIDDLAEKARAIAIRYDAQAVTAPA